MKDYRIAEEAQNARLNPRLRAKGYGRVRTVTLRPADAQ